MIVDSHKPDPPPHGHSTDRAASHVCSHPPDRTFRGFGAENPSTYESMKFLNWIQRIYICEMFGRATATDYWDKETQHYHIVRTALYYTEVPFER